MKEQPYQSIDKQLIENLVDKEEDDSAILTGSIIMDDQDDLKSQSRRQGKKMPPSSSIDIKGADKIRLSANLKSSQRGSRSSFRNALGSQSDDIGDLENAQLQQLNNIDDDIEICDEDASAAPSDNSANNVTIQDDSLDIGKKLTTSLLNAIGHDQNRLSDQVPEAMPLIRKISLLNSREPDIYQKLRRGQNNDGYNYQNREAECNHEELIENWKCSTCKANIAKFDFMFDDNQGKVNTFTKVVYENSFLDDFKEEFRSQAQLLAARSGNPDGRPNRSVLIYQSYMPNTLLELKEYSFMIMCKRIKKQNKAVAEKVGASSGPEYEKLQSPFGSGNYQNISSRLLKYLVNFNERQKKLRAQHGTSFLLFHSMFESGNLLQAEKSATEKDSYNLFMQVDTNTRGHQQWFYFKAKGGVKGKKYTFNIMNFTKPGVTGGRGYKQGDHMMRVMVKSKKKATQKWDNITNENSQCEYIKTNVARRKKDVIAAGADSDQEDWVEEAFNQNVAQPGATQQQNQQLPTININGPPDTNQKLTQNNENNVAPKEKPKKRRVFYYYALRFQYEFENDDDSVYFAFSEPITYTEILDDLHKKEKFLMPRINVNESVTSIKKNVTKNRSQYNHEETQTIQVNPQKILKTNTFCNNIQIDNPNKLIFYQRTEFCRTLGGIPLYKIVIARDQRCAKKNQIILITSRVHSGETPGSQVFRGIYDFITSDCKEAKYLRRFYTFILIPCMNPDGVIVGNYRNSLAGVDLNRQWINPEPEFHPEVCAVKNLMQQIKEEDKRQIWIFCDIHGHSKKKNSFFYGCNTAANGGFLSWTIVRLLPRIFAQKSHMFNYKDCRFRVEPYKIGTARIVAWKQFQITHSFTLENSFYGYDIGEEQHQIYQPEDYKNLGMKFTISIYEMHFLWKQIRRELQVTHGWLKPRTLNDLTGTPAAQILAEEAAQVKEEARKKKAIEQYEEFLKTFYKGKQPQFKPQQIKLRNGLKPNQQTNEVAEAGGVQLKDKLKPVSNNAEVVKKLDESNGLAEKEDKTQKLQDQEEEKKDLEEASKNEKDTPQDEDDLPDDENYMFRLHQGLVKIQALIRGFLERLRHKKRLLKNHNKMIQKSIKNNGRSIPRQRSNQILKKSQSKKTNLGRLNAPSQMNIKGYDTSSDKNTTAGGTNQNLNNLEDNSNEEQLLRSNTEQINVKNLSDSGTTPSQDTGGGTILGGMFNKGAKGGPTAGLDWREYFQGDELDKAYQIVEVEQRDETDNDSDASMGSNSNPSEDNFDEEEMYRNLYCLKNPEEKIEKRKAREQEFFDQVQTDVQTQQDVLDAFARQKTNVENEQKKQEARKKQQNSQVPKKLNLTKSKEVLLHDASIHHQSQKGAAPNDEESIFTTPYTKNNNNEGDTFSQQAKNYISNQNLQKSSNYSPVNKAEQPQNGDNMFNSMGLNGRRQLKSSNQQRALTQQQQMQLNSVNPGAKEKKSQQAYKIQHPNFQYGTQKKENINQVIKDCFITKKMNTKKETTGSNRQGQLYPSASPIKSQPSSSKKQNKLIMKMQAMNNQINIRLSHQQYQNNPQSSVQNSQDQEEVIHQKNSVLLHQIISNTLKTHNLTSDQSHHVLRQTLTAQLLQRLNENMTGMSQMQAHQYLQMVHVHTLQQFNNNNANNNQQNQNRQKSSALDKIQFYPGQGVQSTSQHQPTDESYHYDGEIVHGQQPQMSKRLKNNNQQKIMKRSLTHNLAQYQVNPNDKYQSQTTLNITNVQNSSPSGIHRYNPNLVKPPSASRASKAAAQFALQENQAQFGVHNSQSKINMLNKSFHNTQSTFMPSIDSTIRENQQNNYVLQSTAQTASHAQHLQQQQNLGSSLVMKYMKKKAQQNNNLLMKYNSSSNAGSQISNMHPNVQNSQQIAEDDENLYRTYDSEIKDYEQYSSQIQQHQQYGNLLASQSGTNLTSNLNMGDSQLQEMAQTHLLQGFPQQDQAKQGNRVHSANINHHLQSGTSTHHNQNINDDIVTTKELINEIKQLRLHQQQQIQLQQQLQMQLQNQFQRQQQIVQFNEINLYQTPTVQSFGMQQQQPNMVQHLNSQQKQAYQIDNILQQHNATKEKMLNQQEAPIQLQAADKIPVGLQALMNKQNNLNDMHQMLINNAQMSRPQQSLQNRGDTQKQQSAKYFSNPVKVSHRLQQNNKQHPKNVRGPSMAGIKQQDIKTPMVKMSLNPQQQNIYYK